MKTVSQPNSIPLSDESTLPARRSFNEQFREPLKDDFTATGLTLIVLSSITFGLFSWFAKPESDALVPFLLNYIAAFVYGIMLISKLVSKFRKGKSSDREFTVPVLLWLVLSLISCYSLNRSLPVFQQSTLWQCIYLVVTCVAATAMVWHKQLPQLVLRVIYFVLASALPLMLYLTIYLLPLSFLGLVGSILLGVGAHTFIPLIFSITLCVILWNQARTHSWTRLSIGLGIALPLAVTTFFLIHWNRHLTTIHRIDNQTLTQYTTLPRWVMLSQRLSHDWVMERILKSDLVYTTKMWEDGFNRFPNTSFEDVQEHDPLVTIAVLLLGKADFSTDEQVKLIRSLYNARHQGQERLWSGDHLHTQHVHTNVKVYPEYRLAYTEKILTIVNNSHSTWNQQEAIYTFHLPEGSVITSLSLWVNGVEEAARLTTKAKADSAYTTIVGQERRDPSVVHWQEGNTVTVRVFPCTSRESRKFKLGMTSPLRKGGNRLFYDNIYFEGPATNRTRENVSINFVTPPQDAAGMESFDSEANLTFTDESGYQPDRSFSFLAPALATQPFVFQGKSYRANSYTKQYEPFAPKAVYLDINNAWTLREYETAFDIAKPATVWVWDNQWVQLNETNLLPMYEKLWQNRFSLLPIHQISHPESALIIAKSDAPTPSLSDLKNSSFAKDLGNQLQTGQTIRMFHIGHTLSPYLKTLTELRILNYDQGNITYLRQLLSNKQFVQSVETQQTITLPQAEMQLTEAETSTLDTHTAPDHLLRLFAYNHLMQQIGPHYFEKDYLTDTLIAQAQRAYVVSPVSSLVVLETKEDYERFGIDKAKNSLQNAALNKSGAVPEPHEWLLILTAVVAIGVFIWKQK